ncbi:MAG: N-6 DNA methylase [Elusimicrobia bacterium]|nr:N-6 DNA methylase [Candidatus Liberimonas magnetica]
MRTHNQILTSLTNAFKSIGYRNNLIQPNYQYVDFFEKDFPQSRTIDLGIFGQEPFDYRSACFGVHLYKNNETIDHLRAFGAPQLFVVHNGTTFHYINKEKSLDKKNEIPTKLLPELIKKHIKDWNPDTVRGAKSGIFPSGIQQIDFIDIGLLPALESEASKKIDQLIKRILANIDEVYKQNNLPAVFHIVFRLLAAKLLSDRDVVSTIDFSNHSVALGSVLTYYGNRFNKEDITKIPKQVISDISQEVGRSFSFKNLSVDTLTYVYENTFVSQESRKNYGIHSTPSYIADYVLSQMPIDKIPVHNLKVFDPMCGHGIFLIAAMRRIRNFLPKDWSGEKRHDFFIKRLRGTDIDSFSIEVARMCLMLADFPERNGWNLNNDDIFRGNLLENEISKTTILVGNPPFGNIKIKSHDIPKPVELLRRVFPKLSKGSLIGMVLPKTILDSNDYKKERDLLLSNFSILSITSLPDKIFKYSDEETVVLIAEKSQEKIKSTFTKYQEVKDKDREKFKTNNKFTYTDAVPQEYFSKDKNLIVPPLRELWERLEKCHRFSEIAVIRTGVEYKSNLDKNRWLINSHSSDAVHGIADTNDIEQFRVINSIYMSTDKELRRNSCHKFEDIDWHIPKVIVPCSRLSRGVWRYVAAIDYKGLMIWRNLCGVWPSNKDISIELLAALLNSPLAQAYVYCHSTQRGVPVRVYKKIPIPDNLHHINYFIEGLVKKYLEDVIKNKEKAKKTLLEIDAEILKIYNMPPKLERQLLDLFWGQKRKVPFDFTGYVPSENASWIPLHVYISDKYKEAHPKNILEKYPVIKDKKLLDYLTKIGTE